MSRIVVRPVRFTDDVAAMRAFLQLLGLRPTIASDNGTWVEMSSGGGVVGVHDASGSDTGGTPGATRLSFESDDLDGLATSLRTAGFGEVTIHDEAYGRVLQVVDPLGDVIAIDGRMDDMYGYRLLDVPGESAHPSVLPVRFTVPTGPYGGFLEALGLTRVDDPNDYYMRYAASSGGSVGLHYVYSKTLPIVAGPGAVHLTFASAEPMDDIAARLRAAGFDPTVTVEEFGAMLSVTDPDGQEVQVHEPPAEAT